MKTVNPRIRLLAYGLLLVTVMYNCKTKDVNSLTPFTYTFKGLDPVTLPTVTPTAPAAVSSTASTITSSTAAAAVTSGVANITATGQVPASVQQAATDVSKAVSADKAAQVAASFTPAVVNNLAAGGTLPASMKADVDAIASNPAVKAYLPTFTLPTVNGKPVGGRQGVGVEVAAIPVQYATNDGSEDACKAAANAAYNTALQQLDAARQTQTAAITAAYTQLQTTIQANATACKTSTPATYTAAKTATKQQLDQGLANLEAAKSVLGDNTYNLLKVLYYVSYAQTINVLNTLQTADTTACDQIANAQLTNAQAARDADLSKINANYNSALTTLTKSRDQAVASCHNQGTGG